MNPAPARREMLNHLPAVFHTSPLMIDLVAACEEVFLTAAEPAVALSLRETISATWRLIKPDEAPSEFLHWLAGWMALTLRDEWGEETNRRIIAAAISLYKWRGTARGLRDFLQITLSARATIVEPEADALTIAVRSTIGVNTRLGRGKPHFFIVQLEPDPGSESRDPRDPKSFENLARYVIDMLKPAHTSYQLVLTAEVGTGS